MKRQVGLVQKCVLSALLSSAAWAIPGMQALAADQLPVKAPAAVEAIPYWWWHGEWILADASSSTIRRRTAQTF